MRPRILDCERRAAGKPLMTPPLPRPSRAIAIAFSGWLAFVCPEVAADVVRAAPNVTSSVKIRAAPSAQSNQIGSLRHGQELELAQGNIDPGWYEVRLPGSNLRAFVSAEWTRIFRTAAPTERAQIEVTLPLKDGRLPVVVTDGPPREMIWIIPRDVLPTVVIMTCSVLILFLAGLQTNTRSRNETFRVLRERFEDLRKKEGIPEALRTSPVSIDGLAHLLTGPIERPAPPDADAKKQAALMALFDKLLRAPEADYAKAHAAIAEEIRTFREEHQKDSKGENSTADNWAHTIGLQEQYWIRAFDEWYITTGGLFVCYGPAWRFTIHLRRTFGVYRALWDQYYRDAIANTVNANPMMMVALWHAYSKGHIETGAPHSNQLDATFLRHMWTIAHESQEKIDLVHKAWNKRVTELNESTSRPLATVRRPLGLPSRRSLGARL